jgi:hypothetical protein
MPTLRSRAWVAAPIGEVFGFFDDPASLSRLMPPPVAIRLVRIEPAPPRPGSIFEFQYGLGPVQRSWTVRLLDRCLAPRDAASNLPRSSAKSAGWDGPQRMPSSQSTSRMSRIVPMMPSPNMFESPLRCFCR